MTCSDANLRSKYLFCFFFPDNQNCFWFPKFVKNDFMIQRIQTVFLLLAAIAMALLFAFPYVEVANDDYFVKEYPIMITFTIILVVGFLITIFFFRNRSLQLRLSRAMLLFIVAFIAYGVYQLFQIDFQNVDFEVGSLLPVFSGYFAARASSKIKADEELVRSVDRLR